jgi:hypothetical protein
LKTFKKERAFKFCVWHQSEAVQHFLCCTQHNLNLTVVCLSSQVTKRSKLNGNTIQGNYVYKPMVAAAAAVNGTGSVGGSRRKAPLLLRASPSASSFIKLEDP